MSNFPGSIPSFAGFTPGHTLSADNHASQHNLEQGEIIAEATKIGTGSSTPASGQVLTGTGAGTSSWSQVNLTTMVSGILPVANGGTGGNNLTFPAGPDTLVGRVTTDTLTNKTLTSPILTTPTIASFVNAVHNHQNSAGGGQLDYAGLLSTIFSGQLQTQVNAGSAGGTMSYINLGGIKLLWCISAAQASNTGGVSVTFTLPSFFSTITAVQTNAINMTTDARQYVAVNSATTSTVTVTLVSTAGTFTTGASLLVIGT